MVVIGPPKAGKTNLIKSLLKICQISVVQWLNVQQIGLKNINQILQEIYVKSKRKATCILDLLSNSSLKMIELKDNFILETCVLTDLDPG